MEVLLSLSRLEKWSFKGSWHSKGPFLAFLSSIMYEEIQSALSNLGLCAFDVLVKRGRKSGICLICLVEIKYKTSIRNQFGPNFKSTFLRTKTNLNDATVLC